MTRQRSAQTLAGLSAVGFFVAAALHTSGYGSVRLLAQQGPPDLAPLVSALWLAWAVGLVVLGVLVTLVALGRLPGARVVLLCAAAYPLATAVLQLNFLGFIPPVGILSGIGVLSVAGAIVLPSVRQPTAVGAA